MALTFPLPLADFWGRLPIAALALEPTDPIVTSRTRSGAVLTAQVGDMLWRGTATLAHRTEADSEFVRARLQLLRRTGGSFLVTPTQRRGPLADPRGEVLGHSAPTISRIDANRREIDLAGLPAGYVLSTGDYLSCAYGTGSNRRTFHQVQTGGCATVAGALEKIEVSPPVPSGVTASRPVVLVQPVLIARLDAKPEYGQFAPPAKVAGLALSFVQTLGG